MTQSVDSRYFYNNGCCRRRVVRPRRQRAQCNRDYKKSSVFTQTTNSNSNSNAANTSSTTPSTYSSITNKQTTTPFKTETSTKTQETKSAKEIYNSDGELNDKGTILRAMAGESSDIIKQATQQGACQGAETGRSIGQTLHPRMQKIAGNIGARKGYKKGAQQGAEFGKAVNACIDIAGGKKVNLNDIPNVLVKDENNNDVSLRKMVDEFQQKETTNDNQKLDMALKITDGIEKNLIAQNEKNYNDHGLEAPETKIPNELNQLKLGLEYLKKIDNDQATEIASKAPSEVKKSFLSTTAENIICDKICAFIEAIGPAIDYFRSQKQ